MPKMAPLAYLKKELGFTLPEWQKLGESDKETLKNWAIEEMNALGMLG